MEDLEIDSRQIYQKLEGEGHHSYKAENIQEDSELDEPMKNNIVDIGNRNVSKQVDEYQPLKVSPHQDPGSKYNIAEAESLIQNSNHETCQTAKSLKERVVCKTFYWHNA